MVRGKGALDGLTVLLVEDEYMLADEARRELEGAGAVVLGPVPSVADAERVLGQGPGPDLAVLDVNLRGEMVFAVAGRLTDRGVPIVFTTGYDAAVIPARFSPAAVLMKPVSAGALVDALSRTRPGPP